MTYALLSRSVVFTALGLVPRLFGSDEWIFFTLTVGTNALGSLVGFLLYPLLGRKLYLLSCLGGLGSMPFLPYSIPIAVFSVSLLNPLLTPLGVEKHFTKELYFAFSSGFLLSSLFVYLKLIFPVILVSSILVLLIKGPMVRRTSLREIILTFPSRKVIWLMASNFAVYGAFAVIVNRDTSLYVALFYVAVSISRILTRRLNLSLPLGLGLLAVGTVAFMVTGFQPLTFLLGLLYGPLHPIMADEAGKMGDPLVTVNYVFVTDVPAGFLVPYLLQFGVLVPGSVVVGMLLLTFLTGIRRT